MRGKGRARVSPSVRGFDTRALGWMNGRKLWNALETAVALAEAEAGIGKMCVVEDRHLQVVVKMSKGVHELMCEAEKKGIVGERRGENGEDSDGESKDVELVDEERRVCSTEGLRLRAL